MTLRQFIAAHGLSGAANKIGVSKMTVNRWRNRESSPQGLCAGRLKDLGIKLFVALLAVGVLSGCASMSTIASQWSMGETRVTNHTFGGYSVRSAP